MENRQQWAPEHTTTIFIGGLAQGTTERDIVKYVERFCPVFNLHWPNHKITQKPLSYAFVEVLNARAAQALVARTNIIRGRVVDCQIAVSKEDKQFYKINLLQRKIFIAGIRSFVSFQHLVEELRKRGPLKHCYRIASSHPNRGLAMAEFFDPESATQIVYDGLVVDNCPLRISFFRPKESSSQEEILARDDFESQNIIKGERLELPSSNPNFQGKKKHKKRNNKERKHLNTPIATPQYFDSYEAHQKEPKATETQDLENNYQFNILKPQQISLSEYDRTTVHGSVVFRKTSLSLISNKVQFGTGNKMETDLPANKEERAQLNDPLDIGSQDKLQEHYGAKALESTTQGWKGSDSPKKHQQGSQQLQTFNPRTFKEKNNH